MSAGWIDGLIKAFGGMVNVSKEVLNAADGEKYADGIEKLHQGVSDTYEQMRQVIINSERFSDEEKVERLQKLAQQEAEAKENCGKAIQGNREHVAKIVKDVLFGFVTCGLCFIPGVIKQVKAIISNEAIEIPAADEIIEAFPVEQEN